LNGITIDLLVPTSVSPTPSGRAARLPGHAQTAARNVKGLKGAVVDVDVMQLEALDPADKRVLDMRVAGPAALLVAKVFKIADRVGTTRSIDKDALDTYRLLRGTDRQELAARYQKLLSDIR